jgi:tetratricopeptide (TPR) repeat protein
VKLGHSTGVARPTGHTARHRAISWVVNPVTTDISTATTKAPHTNKIDEAGKIFEESYVKILSPEIHAWHKDHLEILNHIGTYYELMDKYDLATKTLKKASDIAYDKYHSDDPTYGIELDGIAQLEIKLGQYEKAEEDINKSMKILEEKSG